MWCLGNRGVPPLCPGLGMHGRGAPGVPGAGCFRAVLCPPWAQTRSEYSLRSEQTPVPHTLPSPVPMPVCWLGSRQVGLSQYPWSASLIAAVLLSDVAVSERFWQQSNWKMLRDPPG